MWTKEKSPLLGASAKRKREWMKLTKIDQFYQDCPMFSYRELQNSNKVNKFQEIFEMILSRRLSLLSK